MTKKRANNTSAAILARKLSWLLMIFGVICPAMADDAALRLRSTGQQISSLNSVYCHNAQTQEGTVNLERFKSLSDFDQDRSLWKVVFDVVEANQMPLATVARSAMRMLAISNASPGKRLSRPLKRHPCRNGLLKTRESKVS